MLYCSWGNFYRISSYYVVSQHAIGITFWYENKEIWPIIYGMLQSWTNRGAISPFLANAGHNAMNHGVVP